jgi:ATP-binding cassette, subfamily B, bacterial
LNIRTKKFLSYYRPYLGLLFTDILCAVIVSAITLVLPLLARHITGSILQNPTPDALNEIYTIGALMLVLVVVQILCNAFVDVQGHMMGTYMESDMRGELFDHYQKLSFRFYDEQKTGQLMSRLTNDLFGVSELCHHFPEEVVIALLKFVGSFLILLTINVPLTLLLFFFMPFMAVYALYFNRRMNTTFQRNMDRVGDINAQVEDALAGIRVVKSFSNEAVEQGKFDLQNRRFVESRRDDYRNEAYFYQGMQLFVQLLTVTVIVIGGTAILNNTLELADLLTYLLFIAILIDPIQKFANLSRLYQAGIAGFQRFIEVMENEPDIIDTPNAIELSDVEGNIEFRNVSFRYKDDYPYVLKNLSLNIQAGEFVALVGSSGVGKTTLSALIPRFYEVTTGEILLDGVNIKDIRLASLRRQIGIVQQDVYLFAGSVRENIAYGKLYASDEEIIEAAQEANAHDFIMALPQGYDTDIGQRGVKLSGGQKQRLSIARVFLKNPPIIIFDEATSALDNESEKAVQDSLEKLRQNRTTLVIAHRLTTVQNAERIIVLTEAGIEEEGTHETLLQSNGTYANLYNMGVKI